jgi:hypothetical protein
MIANFHPSVLKRYFDLLRLADEDILPNDHDDDIEKMAPFLAQIQSGDAQQRQQGSTSLFDWRRAKLMVLSQSGKKRDYFNDEDLLLIGWMFNQQPHYVPMQYFTYWKNRLAKKVFAEIKNNLRNDGMF